MSQAVTIDRVTYAYTKDRRALDGLCFSIESGKIFGVLGPNGSGKSTLFRLLSTLAPLQVGAGSIQVFGKDIVADASAIRKLIGVLFQSPSLDPKLTVTENLRCHGILYGFAGRLLDQRIHECMEMLSIKDRSKDRTETLSGGLKRRVELAKCLLHRPRLMLLDEPSTGLDPSARLEFSQSLKQVNRNDGTTIVLTTHLMDEAEACDEIAVLNDGKCVVQGEPTQLRQDAGDQVITIESSQADSLSASLRTEFGLQPQVLQRQIRFTSDNGVALSRQISESFASQIEVLSVGKPTLQDVFVMRTGKQFY